MDPDHAPARRLWHAVEPLHAVVYFAPETAQAAKDTGLKGFWMGYFAGRAAPMGRVVPSVVEAAFFNFHPSMVQRALPDAWALSEPETVLRTRWDAAVAALRRILGEDSRIPEAADLARAACDALDCSGRPLGAAWGAVAWRDEPLDDLWLACGILREHRGDGHVAALLAAGLNGLQAHVLAAATSAIPREALQPNRGWTDEHWNHAEDELRARGWVDAAGRATEAGLDARAAIERRTDELALPPLRTLGPQRAARLTSLLEPLAAAVTEAEAVPFPNPIGLPRTGTVAR